MSKFIEKLKQLSQAAPQPMGFRLKQPSLPKPKIQLVAVLAQEGVGQLASYVVGADAGLLRISKLDSGVKNLKKATESVPDIPWGLWLKDSDPGGIKKFSQVGCDFVVFPAATTPLILLKNEDVGKILEVEASITEGLLRAVNELPIDAVLIASEQREDYLLTWQHLMLFQRFADLLTKPLLVCAPPGVTDEELRALWEAGVDGIVVDVTPGQSQDKLRELRQVIDRLAFPIPRRREKIEAMLPRTPSETSTVVEEEEEEE